MGGSASLARSSDLVAKREPKVYDTYAFATTSKKELRVSRKPIHATYQRAMTHEIDTCVMIVSRGGECNEADGMAGLTP